MSHGPSRPFDGAVETLNHAAVLPQPARLVPARWTGALIEFLLVGGLTPLFVFASFLARQSFGLDSTELLVGFLAFHGAALINDPHFAVTYLLFYKDAKRRALGDVFSLDQRIRYVVCGALVPTVLIAWAGFALATDSALLLGAMIQLMFFLVGWHYVKQGFGVLTVLSARRGVPFGGWERKALLFHAFAGWAYAWASPRDPGRSVIEKGVVYTSLGQPPWLEPLLQGVFYASAFAFGATLVARLRRSQPLPPASPLFGFLVTIWVWMAYPSIDPLLVYVIPAFHSVQYLYFVWLLRRNQARAAVRAADVASHDDPVPSFHGVTRRLWMLALTACALGWLLFHGAPGFLDQTLGLRHATSDRPLGLGPTPYFAALFTIVNIHHYFMDFVIWRRENPDTRYLFQP